MTKTDLERYWHRLRVWNLFLFSHLPFLGTLPRTLVALLPIILLAMVFKGIDLDFWFVFWFWIGMSWSDLWHVVADVITSDFKETKRGFWHRRLKYGPKYEGWR